MQRLHPSSVSSTLLHHTHVACAHTIDTHDRRSLEFSDHDCFEQGPGGCDAIDWEQSQASYLRQILVARVYEVAVRLR